MYANEQFQKISAIEKGELVMKLPGKTIKMPYSKGTAFVNQAGNVGYVSLSINNLVAETFGKPEDILGMLEAQLAEQLPTPDLKKQIKKLVASSPVSLFYSKTSDGLEILTIPGLSGTTPIAENTMPGMIIGTYNISGAIPSVEQVYDLHLQVVANRNISKDKHGIQTSTSSLPQKANTVYDNTLNILKNLYVSHDSTHYLMKKLNLMKKLDF